MLYLPCYCKISSSAQLVSADGEVIDSDIQHILGRKQKLAWVLTIILPLYTVNYLIACSGGISPAETIAIYQILSVLTKGLFACVAMVCTTDNSASLHVRHQITTVCIYVCRIPIWTCWRASAVLSLWNETAAKLRKKTSATSTRREETF